MEANLFEPNLTLANYPGGIDRNEPSIYRFPEMISQAVNGNDQLWQIYVQLCEGDADYAARAEASGKIVPIAITENYFTTTDNTRLQPIYCRILVRQGQLKVKINAPTLVFHGKNKGKANQTTVFKQAMIDAYGKYKDRLLRHNFKANSPHLAPAERAKPNGANRILADREAASYIISPMLAKKDVVMQRWFDQYRAEWGPIYAQTKLNGMHVLAIVPRADPKTPDRLIMYSREATQLMPQVFSNELRALCMRYRGITFDAEVYNHGIELQRILSSMKDTSGQAALPNLMFNIFDFYDPERPELTYTARLRLMMGEYTQFLQSQGAKLVRFLPSGVVDSVAEVEAALKTTIEHGFEGIILRLGGKPYEPQTGQTRSINSIKYKAVFSSEFEIIGWSTGEGKASHQLATWTLKVTQESIDRAELPRSVDAQGNISVKNLALGAVFKSTPAATEAQKVAWYKQFSNDPDSFEQEYAGHMATVNYLDVSLDGIPLQSNMIGLREGNE